MKTLLLIALATIVLYFPSKSSPASVSSFMSFAERAIRYGHNSPTYWVRMPGIQSQVKHSRV